MILQNAESGNKKRDPKETQLWALFYFFALCGIFFSIFLVYRQWSIQFLNTQRLAKSDLELLKILVHAELQKRNYEIVRNFIVEWGQKNTENISEIKVVSKNNFVLAHYQREGATVIPLRLQRDLAYSYRGKAKLILTWDLSALRKDVIKFALLLLFAASAVASLVYYIIRQIILRRRESIALRKKSEELNLMNEELSSAYEEMEATYAELEATNDELLRANERYEIQNQDLKDSQLKILENEKKIKVSLDEKEILLNEVHHRVKNNLQLISSMLSLQMPSIRDEKDRGLFLDSRNRIRSMAIIHEKLYHNRNVSEINFRDYLESLTEEIRKSYQPAGKNIKVFLDMQQITLNLNTAIPCALIVNELLSNAFKHAFREMEEGEIRVCFEKSDSDFILQVSDKGVGLPQGYEPQIAESLGMKIVRALIQQLSGTGEITSNNGLTYRILFKDAY